MSEPPKPAAPIAPGNYDRSWNDPPLFSYTESSTQQSQHTGLKLNKRVGFPTSAPPPPLSKDGGQPPKLYDAGMKPPVSGLPPPPPRLHDAGARPATDTMLPPPPSVVPAASSGDSGSVETVADMSNADICQQLKEFAQKFCGESSSDIVKRLGMMEKGLESGKLPSRIPVLLAELCRAIEMDRFAEADKKLTTLGADYAGDCAQ